MKNVEYNGIKFKPFITRDAIHTRVRQIASAISDDYKDKCPLVVCVLNGAFPFASEIFMNLDIDAEITFVRLKSYCGTDSTGNIEELIGLAENIRNRHIVIVEDIIDTGLTIRRLLDAVRLRMPASVRTATLLYKPDVCRHAVTPDYIGFTIPPRFIIGYGLDIDGFGRNLNDIYVADDDIQNHLS